MQRWGGYGRSDTQWVPDGDPAFKGVNMLLDRSQLGPGYLARSENKRLRDGVAATRPGTVFLPDFNPLFGGRIIGSHIYSNPNGDEIMLVACINQSFVWALQHGKDPRKVGIAPIGSTHGTDNPVEGQGVTGVTTGARVEFCQAFDKILMFRFPAGPSGTVAPTLVWNGTSYPNPALADPNQQGFRPIRLSDEGLRIVPPYNGFGVPFQNRVLYYDSYVPSVPARNRIIMSDVLDYTSYDNILGVFRINAGESDSITSVFPYLAGSVVVFMRESVHLLENFTVDPFQSSQRLLNSRLGSEGSYGPLMVGGDIIFLARSGGFYRLSQIISETNITATPIPVSRPIQPIIDRIEWKWARYMATALLDDYAYFALPLLNRMGGGAASHIVVLNTATNEWESAPDSWAGNFQVHINRLLVTLYNGAHRLYGLDYAASRIYLLYEGLLDEIVPRADGVGSDSVPVRDVIETRGYVFNDPLGFKRAERAVIAIRSWEPNVWVTALSDGFNEEKLIAAISKDRNQFYQHGHPPYDGSNPKEPKRQDYSDQPSDYVQIEDFEELPLGQINTIPETPPGSFNGIKQQSLERLSVRQIGRRCSLRIEGFSGQTDIVAVGVEAQVAQETARTVA